MSQTERKFTSVEICAGAGGQAVGLHMAGFRHKALIEIDEDACQTLNLNVSRKRSWAGCHVLKRDLKKFNAAELSLARGELDLLAGGVPCPPFSAAGKQLGADDERDLFPDMLRLVDALRPKAVMIENVRGLLEPPDKFRAYREGIEDHLKSAGYAMCMWDVLEARDFGVPQLRPRAILVAMLPEYARLFDPTPLIKPDVKQRTVTEALWRSMRERFRQHGAQGWEWAYRRWKRKARSVAPTLVGGSKKHGGADLGPTRAKREWRKLGVDAMGVANEPEEMEDPGRDLYAKDKKTGELIGPKLTVKQAALLQGFPPSWKFSGRKTAAYRQVGNAFPPPVAKAVGDQILLALKSRIQEMEQDMMLFDADEMLGQPSSPRVSVSQRSGELQPEYVAAG